MVAVGNLLNVQGRNVVVARQRYRFQREETTIPETGYLTVNITEALTDIRRRQRAVDAFLFDQMANPALPGIIVDPSTSTQMALHELRFFQEWLSDDKREVVRRAVSTNDIFLIQGPPGTGEDISHCGDRPADSQAEPAVPDPAELAVERGCRSRIDPDRSCWG